AQSYAAAGLQVDVTRVEASPGDLAGLPAPLALSAYRCVQESLTNVSHHSTATRAQVTLRPGGAPEERWLEVEVLDAGRPRPGTAGTGDGLPGTGGAAGRGQG